MSQLGTRSRNAAAARSAASFAVPPALRPVLRAYALGYASAVAPRLLTLAVQHILKLRRNSSNLLPADPEDEPTLLAGVRHILRSGFDPRRFPTFCAVLVAGTSLLHVRISFTQHDGQLLSFNPSPCITMHHYAPRPLSHVCGHLIAIITNTNPCNCRNLLIKSLPVLAPD